MKRSYPGWFRGPIIIGFTVKPDPPELFECSPEWCQFFLISMLWVPGLVKNYSQIDKNNRLTWKNLDFWLYRYTSHITVLLSRIVHLILTPYRTSNKRFYTLQKDETRKKRIFKELMEIAFKLKRNGSKIDIYQNTVSFAGDLRDNFMHIFHLGGYWCHWRRQRLGYCYGMC